MNNINRFIILGFLIVFVCGEITAMNQQMRAEVPQNNNSQELKNRLGAWLGGGTWYFALAKLNGDQSMSALTKSAFLGFAFSMFCDKESFVSGIGASACAAGTARLLGSSNWLQAGIWGGVLGMAAPLAFTVFRDWQKGTEEEEGRTRVRLFEAHKRDEI